MCFFSPRTRILALCFFLCAPLVVMSCGSDSGGGGPEFPPLTCDKELLAGGTYVFTVTQLGNTCFSSFDEQIRGIFDGTPLDAPSYGEIDTNPNVSLTILGVTVNATIVVQGNQFVLTNINPNPIHVVYDGNNVTATINSVVICATSETAITADINATVTVEGFPGECRDTGRVTGVLQQAIPL